MNNISIRAFIFNTLSIAVLVIVFGLSGCGKEESEKDEAAGGREEEMEMTATIVAVGDSLTAGYGLDEEQAYPYLLGKKLQQEGYGYKVINAGVSAETSSGTLSRLDWVLSMEPDIVILETGANDGLRGTSTDLVEKNLRSILETLKERNVTVLLAGMRMVWNLGPMYVRKFNTIYPDLAEEFELELMPFFLEDVAMKRDLNLGDGIHPNGDGYKIIVENIFPHVVNVINQHEKK